MMNDDVTDDVTTSNNDQANEIEMEHNTAEDDVLNTPVDDVIDHDAIEGADSFG